MTQKQNALPHLGQLFREIRTSKGISISRLDDEYISKSMTSKFERGASDLSITRFLHLLERIDMRPEEFFAYRTNAQTMDTEKLIRRFYDAFFAKERASLKELILECRQLAEVTNHTNYSYLETMIWQGLSDLGERELPEDFERNKQAVFDYLFTCEKWFRLEFHLFGNLADALSLDSFLLFARPIARDIHQHLASPSEAMAESILTNVLYLACLEKRADIADEFARIIEQIELDERNTTSRIFFKFYLGCYYRYMKRNEKRGHQMMETAKMILKELECWGRLQYLLRYETELDRHYKTS